MRILYITPYFPEPDKKAGSKFTFNQIKVLNELGYKIDLVSITKFDDLNINIIKNYVNNLLIYKRKNDFFSYIKSLFLSLLFKQSFFLNLLPLEFVKQIKVLLDSNNYEKIYLEHSYMALWFRSEFGNKYDGKLRIVMHNIEKEYFEYMYKNENLNLHRMFYWLEYKFLFHNENNLLRNKNLKFLFHNENNAKKYNGLFLPSFPFNIEKISERIKFSIGYIGFLGSQRNINALKFFLENIWEILLHKDKNITFCIAGRGLNNKDKKYFERFKNVVILGEINNLEEFYSMCEVIIVPILESIGVQTKLYEALSFLKPVVCTEYALKGTPFKNNIHLFATNEFEKFADYCLLLLKDKKNSSKLKNNIINLERQIKLQTNKALKI